MNNTKIITPNILLLLYLYFYMYMHKLEGMVYFLLLIVIT